MTTDHNALHALELAMTQVNRIVLGKKDQVRLCFACLLAGGFTDFASLRQVKLPREVDGQPRTAVIDVVTVRQGKQSDPPVASGDRLEIPRRRF